MAVLWKISGGSCYRALTAQNSDFGSNVGKNEIYEILYCSHSKFTIYKLNRLFEVVCLVVKERVLLHFNISFMYCMPC